MRHIHFEEVIERTVQEFESPDQLVNALTDAEWNTPG